MIGFTKILCGYATVADAFKHGHGGKVPPHLLQFSTDYRPIVVWNTTYSCNLKCRHCYIDADTTTGSDELTTSEAEAFIDDLAAMKVPVVLFSGGEPLLREDLFHLGELAVQKGIRTVVSTNGTLIDDHTAEKLKVSGFSYVGVSIDGARATHDEFRGVEGCFQKAIAGIENSMKHGIKSGIRFTLNESNKDDLPEIFKLVEELGIPRLCIYHLVYSGRGREMAREDVDKQTKREIIEYIIHKSLELRENNVDVEVLSTDNHADGVLILKYIREKMPHKLDEVMELLKMHGGCSAGTKTANVDPIGNVHPCQFWGHLNLGNIRNKPFSRIWRDENNDLLYKLRNKAKHLKGKCARCKYVEICGGCRIRAEAIHNDVWAEDPACYLTEEEIFGEG